MAIKNMKKYNEYELNKELKGTVVEYHIFDEDENPNMKVCIQLDDADKVVCKTFFIDMEINSSFSQFCINCGVVNDKGEIDLSELLYSDVVVCLILTESNKIMVDYIKKYPGEGYELIDYNQL